ncbi:GtrA family protein [Tuanshanicoccus lijuaniae]|uniref:GtrA family protein n=1 Tax=Aerococcaceae bacterium zg-1292 TaxID=2774330 RepID=UPI001935A8AC|nr:GtrA family protein [Aerococcaceae bacterium zg-1292]MBF6977972.1 GtrA family protein [Aerococcaceae bacterium zg-BR22]MBS4455827.1 GtrA family protein [Aerococcaceae bacterium zg-A91]MBS4457635.1 GtrA family protein [Aerococcaceae bacterium zg-BR33]QQA37954.1 GtrA family protein [Aerococcaceae bacterium zg-1292]
MQKLIQQIVKFGIVGVIATLIDWSIFYLLFGVFHIWYLLAKTIAFGISTVFNYYLSMKYVFVSRFEAQERAREFQLFVLLSVIGLLLTLGLMWVVVELLAISPGIANILVAIVVMTTNFILRKLVLEKRN